MELGGNEPTMMGGDVRRLLWITSNISRPFIDTFCRPDLSPCDFKNQLGSFTPCFIDLLVISPAYALAVALLAARLAYLMQETGIKYRICNAMRGIKISAVVASFFCCSVPIMQLNGRLANSLVPLGGGGSGDTGGIAPYEWPEYGLAIVAWLLFGCVQLRELQFYRPQHVWTARFPQVLVLAANLAKLHFVLRLHDSQDEGNSYFFYLFLVFCCAQGYLVLIALFVYPAKHDLLPIDNGSSALYEPLLDEDDMTFEDGSLRGLGSDPTVDADAHVCPEAKAGLLSRLTFSWISPLLRLGYQAPLQNEDIWAVPPGDRVAELRPTFQRHWWAELSGRRPPSLRRAVTATFGYLFLQALPVKILNDVMQFGGPFFLSKLLNVVDTKEPASLGYTYAAGMLVTAFIGTIADGQHFQLVMRAGFRIKAVLAAEVYRKSLVLSPSSRNDVSSGKIINLVTTDVEQIKMVCQTLLSIISAPLRIIICMVMLYAQLGPASMAGLAVMILSTPINSMLMRRSQQVFRGSLVRSDERTKLVNDLIASIEVVKCMAWEPMLLKRVLEVRNGELAALWNAFRLQIWVSVLLNAIPTLVSVAAFAVYVLLGNELTPASAFTSLTLFNQLRFPLFSLPMTITQLSLAMVGLGRLQDFLTLSEQPTEAPLAAAEEGEVAIRLAGDFTWDGSQSVPTLQGVDISVPAQSLVAVVGSTGSGKSSLLQAMMGFMEKVAGPEEPRHVAGSLAYVPQSAFIYGGTVRENILFGSPFEQTRYNESVDAANLGPDLEALPAGDHTELGDKGLNVSGGQKQRISIARAVYSGSDVVLMDDPLSALDAKVARRVFTRCIKSYLRTRTVVLATNQLQFVEDADLVLFLKDGRITEAGTFNELMGKEGGEFAAMMAESNAEVEAGDEAEDGAVEMEAPEVADKQGAAERVANSGKLTVEEGRSSGSLSWETVREYARELGGRLTHLSLHTTFFGQEAVRTAASLWLTLWTSSSGTPHAHTAYYYLAIYSAISLLQVLLLAGFTAIFKRSTIRASAALHERLLHTLLRAPLSFFHTNPTGRVINRCTKDVSEMDKNIADASSMFTRALLTLVSTCILMGAVSPILLPFIALVMLVFYFMYLYFQSSVRETKRLESVSYSPLYSSFADGIAGLSTIRAYQQEGRLVIANQRLIDNTTRFQLAQQSFNRWLTIRQESLGALVAFIAAVVSVEERNTGGAAILGLVVSYALSVSQSVAMTIRLASMAEVAFNSVDRVLEYCSVPPEAAEVIEGACPPGWPETGRVEYEGVQMRYREGLPLVLRGLNVKVEAGAKCGVVGRTGAGKSSLINTLFRLMELDDGCIKVDGVDISTLGLHQLRHALSIIPQVPALFTGTLRFNLDPFGQYSDEAMWKAIQRAHLQEVVARNPLGLDMHLREGGSPFSMGQKQLVALARALLKSSKVLVLDEATASVDVKTDALIQKTIREEFTSCTLIAIAHRLHTVIDSDLLLVMDAGCAVECGKPAELLSNPEGVFTEMVRETGEATERFLRAVAFGESGMMVEELNRKANVAKEEIMNAKDPQSAVCELIAMANVSKSRIAKLLGAMAEVEEVQSNMQGIDEVEMPASTCAILDCGTQLQTAATALQDILHVVSELEMRLSSHRTTTLSSAPQPRSPFETAAGRGVPPPRHSHEGVGVDPELSFSGPIQWSRALSLRSPSDRLGVNGGRPSRRLSDAQQFATEQQ